MTTFTVAIVGRAIIALERQIQNRTAKKAKNECVKKIILKF